MIPTEDLIRMTMEVQANPDYAPEESDERRRVREQLREDVAAILAMGGQVDLPPEIP